MKREFFGMTDVLKQMKNTVKIVGTLKSKNLQYDKDNNQVDVIRGNVVVEVKKGDKVNNIFVNVYTKAITNSGKKNGYYKGFQTIIDEYKDADTYNEAADRISVVGNISYNVYMDSNGTLRQSNRIRADRFHRINDEKNNDEEVHDVAVGTTGVIVLGYKDVLDQDGVPTGETLIKAINVGYNGRINKLVNLQVKSDLGMQEFAPEQTPIEISFNINNYVVVEKKPKKTSSFGNFVDVATNNSFTSNLEVTGGVHIAYDFTEDQLKEGAKSLRLMVEEAKKNTPENKTKSFVNHDSGFNNYLDNHKKAAPKQAPKPQPKPESKPENSLNPFDDNDTISDDDFPDSF